MNATPGGDPDTTSAAERWKNRLLLAGLLAVSAVMMAAGAAMLVDARDPLLGGGRAPGTVVDLRPTGRNFAPVIEYRVGGQKYLCTARISTFGYERGHAVTVRYHPDRPAGGRLDTFGELWLFPLVLLGFGAVIFVQGVRGKVRIPS